MLLLTKYTVLYKENEICCIILLSLPSRERGLKSFNPTAENMAKWVAPFAGAWIEIPSITTITSWVLSLPSRERGLKFPDTLLDEYDTLVAPFAGAWIEIACDSTSIEHCLKSLPSRERGLKFLQ